MSDLPGLWIITATGGRHEFYFRDEEAQARFIEDLPAMCVFRYREVSYQPEPHGITMDRICGLCEQPGIPRGVDWPWWLDGRPVHPTCLEIRKAEKENDEQDAGDERA